MVFFILKFVNIRAIRHYFIILTLLSLFKARMMKITFDQENENKDEPPPPMSESKKEAVRRLMATPS